MKLNRLSDDSLEVSDLFGKKINLASSTGHYKKVQVFSQLRKGKHQNDKECTYHIQVLTQECVRQKPKLTKVSNQSVNLPDIFGYILGVFPSGSALFSYYFHFKVFSGHHCGMQLYQPELSHRHAQAFVFWGCCCFCCCCVFVLFQQQISDQSDSNEGRIIIFHAVKMPVSCKQPQP